MKYYSLPIAIILTSHLATTYAAPPYLGVSVGENLAFQDSSCIQAGKDVLKQNGFSKIVQYPQSATIFAAYRDGTAYQYKVLIKCLATSGVIMVTAIANIPREAKSQAESVRRQIQQYADIKPAPEESCSTDEENQEKKILELENAVEKNDNISEAWQKTVLNRNQCFLRAEISLRKSGFYRDIQFDEDSIYGQHQQQLEGAIQCLTTDNQIHFQVTGENLKLREQLLEKLQRNF
jgi:hypothetical protein